LCRFFHLLALDNIQRRRGREVCVREGVEVFKSEKSVNGYLRVRKSQRGERKAKTLFHSYVGPSFDRFDVAQLCTTSVLPHHSIALLSHQRHTPTSHTKHTRNVSCRSTYSNRAHNSTRLALDAHSLRCDGGTLCQGTRRGVGNRLSR
jgi:hypothetical protein